MTAASHLVVGPGELQAGDRIVGIQKLGAADTVAARSGRTVAAVAGEHRTGGQCIPLRWREGDPAGHESNWWNGQDYLDVSLFHVDRPRIGD